MKGLKIGLFGGTFNPIHNGHINVSEYALNKLNLDEVWFIPTFITPEKGAPFKISAEQRLKIIKKSIAYNPKLKVKSFETKIKTVSYTWSTVKNITAKYSDNTFFLLMGDDSFVKFDTWKNYKDIYNSVSKVVVFNRTGEKNHKLEEEVKPIILDNPVWSISSTVVRKGFFSRVPNEAKPFITKNYLYLEEIVREDLSEKRWEHTKSVASWARTIASNNGVNEKRAYYAGITHDMAKEWDQDKMIEFIEKYDGKGKAKDINPKILHARAGYLWWIHVYKSRDKKIGEAILKHTTAAEKMSKLDKIIYTADKIADNRSFDEVQWLRDIAKVDVNMAFSRLITIQYNYGREKIGLNDMDSNTILAFKKYGEK